MRRRGGPRRRRDDNKRSRVGKHHGCSENPFFSLCRCGRLRRLNRVDLVDIPVSEIFQQNNLQPSPAGLNCQVSSLMVTRPPGTLGMHAGVPTRGRWGL